MTKVSFRKGYSLTYDPQLGKWSKSEFHQQDVMELIPISCAKNIRLLERELKVFAEATLATDQYHVGWPLDG